LQVSLLPSRNDALYHVYWGDGSSSDKRDQPISHIYRDPNRNYKLSAWVESDLKMRVDSNTLEVDVEPYKVSLVAPSNPKPGEPVKLTAELTPDPSQAAASGPTEYSFSVPGESDRWQPNAEITHSFEAGQYTVSVSVRIGGITVATDQKTLTIVAGPNPRFPWLIIIIIIIVILVLGGISITAVTQHAVRGRRVRRLWQSIMIRSIPVVGSHTLDHPSLVRSDDVLVVRVLTDDHSSHSAKGAR
jgi:hypothetical protein